MIGSVRTGVRGAALSVARGNGKSALVAGIACAAVDGPLAQARGEVVCVASAFGQARIVFEHVLAFMRDRMNAEPKRWRIQDSANLAVVEDILHPVAHPAALADQGAPVAGERARLPEHLRWHMAGAGQAELADPRQPHAVGDIGLAALQLLDLPGADQHHGDAGRLQRLEGRHSVDAGALGQVAQVSRPLRARRKLRAPMAAEVRVPVRLVCDPWRGRQTSPVSTR